MRKVVVSSTLTDPEWEHTEVWPEATRERVDALKAEDGGDVLVYGSGRLVSALTDLGAVDEYQTLLQPVVLGGGTRARRRRRPHRPRAWCAPRPSPAASSCSCTGPRRPPPTRLRDVQDSAAAPPYPTQWEADVVLRDGGVVHVRPIRPEDHDRVQAFHLNQSPESIYLRFFAPLPRLSERELTRFTTVDHADRVGLVATLGDDIVGIGRYDRVGAGTAEVAFNIADAHQGRGIGSVLLEHLAAAARERGITRFLADVLPQNRKMVAVFSEAGYEVSHRYEDGVIALSFDITRSEHADRVRAAREQRAESRSVQALLHPSSVVVVGASRDPHSIGHRLLANLLDGGFTGTLHVVNPGADEVLGVPSRASVRDLPPPVDLAVVAVPADAVDDVVTDCAAVGVRGLVVVTSGFAETGDEGHRRQRRLVRRARALGMRVVGPNSFGVVNTDDGVRLNASLAPALPTPGPLGLFSQSGALGIAVLDSATRRGLGVSTFVSAGNRADLSGNDLMQYWVDDPRTRAVGLYLESMGNPRKFSRVATRLARTKPVIVVKSGVSSFGVPPGHAVRASTLPREAFDEMLRQAGVVRVDNIHQPVRRRTGSWCSSRCRPARGSPSSPTPTPSGRSPRTPR
ncbi:hypothetical protein GCM10025868_05660 [Angustibacter aerolatus]|uniref:N-acetyltransferase domain-containing protein n=1 Tax=Angustibacter aerolatus TaxID=1162965 RepID=A0ABQ6JAV7_9ACTN|nr:hypothetical protein GCM10025868_05660 [Angustibacter aerolatus]